MQQQRRPVVLATAAGVVLAIAVVAAVVTWGYVRNQNPAGSPLAVAVVFAAVLTAGGVGLVILAGRPDIDVGGRGQPARTLVGGPAPASARHADDPAEAATPADDPADGIDPPTSEQLRTAAELSPRTALDPLGRRYGRHARPEVRPEADEPPALSELYYPLPTDLASTLHDQLFTHRGSARD